jgi:hypothetical protein
VAGLHREVADGNATPGGEFEIGLILNDPAGSGELGVNLAAGFAFG